MNAIPSKPRRSKHAATTSAVDYGYTGRADLTREVADDGTARVSRARVKDPLRAMLKDGRISRLQYNAAECYRDDLDFIAGASSGDPDDRMTGVRGTGRRYGPSDLQMDATERVRRVRRLAGPAWPALTCCVQLGMSVNRLMKTLECSHQRAEGMLQVVLDVLVQFYDGTRP